MQANKQQQSFPPDYSSSILEFSMQNLVGKANYVVMEKKGFEHRGEPISKALTGHFKLSRCRNTKKRSFQKWGVWPRNVPVENLLGEVNTVVIENGGLEDRQISIISRMFGLPNSRFTKKYDHSTEKSFATWKLGIDTFIEVNKAEVL